MAAARFTPRLQAQWLATLGDVQGARTLFEQVHEVFSRTLPEEHPDLQAAIGKDIVTASGATLLGADDKAGIAVAMTLVARQSALAVLSIGSGLNWPTARSVKSPMSQAAATRIPSRRR